MASRYMKNMRANTDHREVQSSPVRHHHTARMKMSWQGHRDVNENNYYGKQYKDSLPKLKYLPCEPAAPLLGDIPKGLSGEAVHITFTAAGSQCPRWHHLGCPDPGWVDKGRILSIQEKMKPWYHSNKDEPGGHYVEWNKPGADKQMTLSAES